MRPIIEPLRSLRSLLRAADGACAIMGQQATDTKLEDAAILASGTARHARAGPGLELEQPYDFRAISKPPLQ